jgi:hypothetical protein
MGASTLFGFLTRVEMAAARIACIRASPTMIRPIGSGADVNYKLIQTAPID